MVWAFGTAVVSRVAALHAVYRSTLAFVRPIKLWPNDFLFTFIITTTVVIPLTFILSVISIPSPLYSFIPSLKPSFSANYSQRSLPFLLQD